jgi:hypothetical protein
MNLYPFNFKNTEYNNWTRKYYLKTGFLCKTEYIAWCMQNRFPFLKEVVHKYCPKVLICVGTTLKLEFKMAFLDNIEEIFEGEKYREMNSKQINKKNIEWSFINNNKTLLLITPFLGRGGFMSDKSLEELATFIKQTIKL